MGFGPPFTPPVVKQLMIALAIMFVAQNLVPTLSGIGVVVPKAVWEMGFLWQPFSYMWLHGGLGHIVMNCFVLWMFGSPLAMAWGAKRFLRYYLICGVGAGFIIATFPYLLYGFGLTTEASLYVPTLGASGAVYGVILAYSLTWPERTIMLIFPPVAFKAIWLIPALFFMTIAFGGGNISHVGHLGGVLVGWLLMRGSGDTGQLLSISQLKHKWHRYRMRQKLRAVQYEEWENQRRDRDDRKH